MVRICLNLKMDGNNPSLITEDTSGSPYKLVGIILSMVLNVDS